MANRIPKEREAEAGTAGQARDAAKKPPREDRDRWHGFSIEEVRQENADAVEEPPATTETP